MAIPSCSGRTERSTGLEDKVPRVSAKLLGREPFRLFFPAAVLVGVAGVALWPLHFGGVVQFYPGQPHARLMAYGFFGGFMIGFLGTALPRLLSAPALRLGETVLLLGLYGLMSGALLLGRTTLGDVLFLLLFGVFSILLLSRFLRRSDLPPPSFVLVLLALACGVAGAILSIRLVALEDAFFLAALQHLLAYQGFLLLPILGVGAFLLPRFFGWPSRHDFPESRTPPPGWTGQALVALAAGLLIVGSFWIEAAGWVRLGPGLRLVVSLLYLAREVPIYRATARGNAPAAVLRVAVVLLLGGFLATVLFPVYRISLLHMTLIGGFALITLTVASRVVYGHSGNLPRLMQKNRWLWWTTGLMILAMATRVSGDLWPKVLVSHYNYGAAVWIVAILLWSLYVLPKVLVPDPEEDPR